MNKETINTHTKAMDILTRYIPRFFESDNYKWDILQVVMDNDGWTREMIRFVETHEEDDKLYKELDYRTMITQTIMHDIGGLMKNDEHFLPRI